MKTPIFPVDRILQWYRRHRRMLPWRKSTDLYGVWVSEVMLQQTRVSTVIPYYRTFLKRWPTVRDLAGAREESVLKVWEGLGYYSRARNLLKAARRVVRDFGGRIPDDEPSFRSLPGVGPYICAAVLSISRDLPLPVVDGNVLRVVTRFRGWTDDITRTATRRKITGYLGQVIPPRRPGDFNQGMMELGATCCRRHNPRCADCPLEKSCEARQKDLTDRLPVRTPRPAVPHYPAALAILLDGDNRIFIQKRPSRAHLGGLWEFPGGKMKSGESPPQALVRECREELHTTVIPEKQIATVDHAYTHFTITLSVFICRLATGAPPPAPDHPHRWVSFSDLKKLPFPAANHKFFADIRDSLRVQRNPTP